MDSEHTVNLSKLVGRNISDRRKILGLTQEEVADRLQITAAALSRIESGRTAPKFSRLRDIAEALGCATSDLFQEDTVKPENTLAGVAEMMKALPCEAQADLIRVFVEMIRTMRKYCPD